MRRKPAATVTLEDRILWETVARTARPLKGRKPTALVTDEEKAETAEKIAVPQKPSDPAASQPAGQPPRSLGLHPIDRPTHKKIAKGRLVIEARIDLHGLTQSAAHGLLLDFLQRAHHRRLRHVLVITGKGSSFGSDGILRQAVPIWFSTPLFRPLVSGYEDAARNHGGSGAIYVRIRKQAEAP
ncbi:Smr/MutS family protein [Phyllobacterium sp. 21LDTY02-6]|nr:Smr/MutS family protein [Phyllobacterium sp. 21LDTY02-6]MCO4317300.1 Smr/MutS family protein [Phyllobacterium sp. 21LDTY02-6]